MNWIADERDETVMTARVRDRCSVSYATGVDGWTCVARFTGGGFRDCAADRVCGSQSNVTLAARRA